MSGFLYQFGLYNLLIYNNLFNFAFKWRLFCGEILPFSYAKTLTFSP